MWQYMQYIYICGTKLVYFYQSELESIHVQGYSLKVECKIVVCEAKPVTRHRGASEAEAEHVCRKIRRPERKHEQKVDRK